MELLAQDDCSLGFESSRTTMSETGTIAFGTGIIRHVTGPGIINGKYVVGWSRQDHGPWKMVDEAINTDA